MQVKDPALLRRMYRSLFRIRRVEEEISVVYPSDRIQSPIHLSIGQEAVSVGVCEALEPGDAVFGTYRSHGYYLAKGGDLKGMVAELYGKAMGVAKGKAGSMHLIDLPHGVMAASAVVATTIPQAVGFAYACRQQRRKAVVVSFFGDGAVEEGAFHESVNFAALKQLPVLFVCENNLYAILSAQKSRQALDNLPERVRAYGMPAERVEGNDLFRIYDWTREAAERIRAGQGGPAFLECRTYRWRDHVGPGEDFHLGYRTRDEAQPWMDGDQVARVAALLNPEDRQRIEREVEAEVREAFAFAEESPFPDHEELYTDVFKEAGGGALG